MTQQTDPNFLTQEQYDDAQGLRTRTHIQQHYRTNPENWFPWIFKHYQLPGQARILELGCGSGDLWLENLDHLPQGWLMILSDLSTGMIQEARESRLGELQRFSYTVLDVQAIPFAAGTFDAVIGNGLIDHVPERVKALDEIWRVLKPGGHFYTTAGGRSHLQEIELLVRPFLPEANYGGDPQRFGLENGEKLLSPWFCEIQRDLYVDELVFKQARPIIEYVLSEASVQFELKGEKRMAFIHFIEQELAARGEIRVKVEKGMFTAVKTTDDGS